MRPPEPPRTASSSSDEESLGDKNNNPREENHVGYVEKVIYVRTKRVGKKTFKNHFN